jgi:hypothetical protein
MARQLDYRPAGPPTATVMVSAREFARTAASAGRLNTTSANCPKSMTRIYGAQTTITHH